MKEIFIIARELVKNSKLTQRELSKLCKFSLGKINNIIKIGIEEKYFVKNNNEIILSKKCLKELDNYKVDSAVIFAAGFGSRFVPLTFETPKGLLEVFGERMIERQIKQLHENDIYDIYIVVGYLKEKFEYLIDKYNVKLLYNPEYATKNTISTLYCAKNLFYNKNTYLLSSDNWIRNNIFNKYEINSWYSSVYMEGETLEWTLKYNKQGIIKDIVIGGENSYVMYGPVYLSKTFSNKFLPILEDYYNRADTYNYYWENVLIDTLRDNKYNLEDIYINMQSSDNVYEFENLEELRLFDDKYINNSNNTAMKLIAEVFNTSEGLIHNLRCLKSGMTNKSFLFDINNTSYICRIPGKGTEQLINRKNEYQNYKKIKDLDICEELVFFDSETGYKISKYYKGSHNANANNIDDIKKCLKVLHKLHDANLQVEHIFDLKERIEFYENLCECSGGINFEDNNIVKKYMLTLYEKLESLNRPKSLSHIDSVCDNFIFTDEKELPRLIDWEYAAMCDPYIDISMMAIYSYFDYEKTNNLIDLYFDYDVDDTKKFIVYSYMALGGYLWALWAIYKSNIGENFGDYTLIMYRYAKDYYKYAMELCDK